MSKSSKLKKHLATLTAALALAAVPMTGYAGGPEGPTTPGGPGGGSPSGGSSTPTTPTIPGSTITYNIGVSTGLYNSLSSAMDILNWAQPLNFLGWSNNPSVPVSNQGAVSQSLGGNGGTSTGLVSTGGGSYDPLSSLKSINDHVVVVETSTKPKRASTGNVKVDQAKTEQLDAAKKLLETAKSGDKDEMKKATEELQKKNDELKKVSEKEQNNTPNQEAYEKSLKDAQEAAKKVEEARAKAELAARDYLNALKTGDPEIIAAYKERLQEANDAYLAARQNEETQINNAINPYTIGGVYNNLTGTPEPGQQGGEQQDNSAESGGFPSLSELLRQYQEQQQQQSGETTIVTVGEPQESDALKRINDLIGKELIERETNARNKLVKAKTSEERQQAMKELDEIHRLETEKVEASRTAEERYGLSHDDFVRMYEQAQREGMDFEAWMSKPEAKAELSALRAQQGEQRTAVVETGGQGGLNIGGSERPVVENVTTRPRTGASQQTTQEKVSVLEQKYKELDETVSKLVSDITSADVAYMKAEDAGASQEELDRLKAERAQIANKRDAIWAERDAAKAELDAARAQKWEQTPVDEKIPVLEQKYKELDETVSKLVSDITSADVAYMKAEDAGASQEELDRLKAERAQIANKRDAVWEERRVAEAELKDAKVQQWEQMPASEKIPVLEQKYKELDETVGKLVSDITAADVAYMKAKDAGASQEELDRLKAERAQIANKRDAVWEERDAAEAELKAARAKATAAE